MKLAEITISYQPKLKSSELPKISGSRDAYNIFLQQWGNTLHYKESVNVLLLSRSNKVLGISKISEGGLSGTVVDPKMIFQTGLKANAASIIIAHNHPSGNTKPSHEDIKLTNRLIECGKFMDMPVLDHVILADDLYFSFADEGLM